MALGTIPSKTPPPGTRRRGTLCAMNTSRRALRHDVRDGIVRSFILESVEVNGVEAVAVDDAGNVYGGYTNTLNFRRWVKK